MTIQQALEVALQHHRSGRLGEAEAIYRQIVNAEPRHADALYYLGVIAHQMGRNDAAVELIGQAIALTPGVSFFHSGLGVALRAKGQLAEAIAACRQAIALTPNFPEAHSNLGNALMDAGHPDEAIEAYRQAIAVQPDFPQAHGNLGVALHNKGRLDDAVAAYRQAIALRPDYPEAHSNLGNALKEKGLLDEAIAAYRQAVVLRPSFPDAHNNLGVALKENGRLDEAIGAFRQAISLRPDYPEAHNNLGNALYDNGQLEEAIAACRQAIALNPDYAEAHHNLGVALKANGQLDEAIASWHHVIALKSSLPEAYNNLGVALTGKGLLREAIDAYHQAIAHKPDLPEAHSNLGTALYKKGQPAEAVAACRRAIALNPNLAEGHHNLSLALLLQGDFLEGWEEHEWRWKAKGFPSPSRIFAQPQWEGGHLEGRTLLLHAEQGFGDAIQFIRYLPLVRARGGPVVIECQTELQRLFQTMEPGLTGVARGGNLPAFDVHCPLLSLPRLFATDLGSIPQNVPYLKADATDAALWRERLAGHPSPFKVGLAWTGSRTHTNDRNRSLKLASLALLAEVPGVQFYSLQKGEAVAEARTPPKGMAWFDFTGELKDFADTAALIANLDLVISVDTSVAHLAGAMGRPVWTLLPFAPDWRWLLGREDSPWYPTMRLFRQSAIGNWSTVIARVREHLQMLVQSQRGKP